MLLLFCFCLQKRWWLLFGSAWTSVFSCTTIVRRGDDDHDHDHDYYSHTLHLFYYLYISRSDMNEVSSSTNLLSCWEKASPRQKGSRTGGYSACPEWGLLWSPFSSPYKVGVDDDDEDYGMEVVMIVIIIMTIMMMMMWFILSLNYDKYIILSIRRVSWRAVVVAGTGKPSRWMDL
jgi:hypothetical protein